VTPSCKAPHTLTDVSAVACLQLHWCFAAAVGRLLTSGPSFVGAFRRLVGSIALKRHVHIASSPPGAHSITQGDIFACAYMCTIYIYIYIYIHIYIYIFIYVLVAVQTRARVPLRPQGRGWLTVSRWRPLGELGRRMPEVWVPGENLPAIGRGGGHTRKTLNEAGKQLVGNLFANVDRIPGHTQRDLYECLSGSVRKHKMDTVTLVSLLAGICPKTARGWYAMFHKSQCGTTPTTPTPECVDAGLSGHVPPLPPPVDAESRGLPLLPLLPCLPLLPSVVAGDDVLDDDDDVAVGTPLPRIQDGQYAIGMRMAELATMWHVNGWSKDQFPRFMLWARERFPHHVGDLNHSVRFLNDFLPSLMAAAHTCTAASLHTVVPATGLPSLLCRVVDVVSINGRSLFPTIHIYTDAGGKLQWALSGCPCLEYVEKEAIGSNQGPGSIFGFHKAPQLVKAVHRVEDSLCIGRDDRAWRLVCTVADQAIQGKGSTQMSREEAAVDRLPEDPLAEGVCKFHIADGVGAHVDARFPETQIFDRMLRLVRRSFAFGTGDVILRSLAINLQTLQQSTTGKPRNTL